MNELKLVSLVEMCDLTAYWNFMANLAVVYILYVWCALLLLITQAYFNMVVWGLFCHIYGCGRIRVIR